MTDVGGNPEIIEDKVNGLVTPSDDEDTLIAACDLLIRDSALRENLARAGRERFEKRFTIDCMLRNYQKLYQLQRQ